MKNLNYLNDKRVEFFGNGDLGDEYNGMFKINYLGTYYKVLATNNDGWEHVSVSHTNRIPSWEVMCKVKELFFEDEEVVIQYHPKKSEYINNHPYCLHLWRPIGVELPTPPIKLVGTKKKF